MNESALFAQQIQSIVNVRFLQQGWEVTHEQRPQALERKAIPQAVPPKAGFSQMPTSDTTKKPKHASNGEKWQE